jgi:hypothetical protein
MVKITQNVEAAYEEETGGYGNPPDSDLLHFGLLDTFDPRAVEMNITPVPSIGQSTDAFHARGPIDVTLPIKVACQGDGWQKLLGFGIGRTYADDGSNLGIPMKLTNSVNSMAVLAKETGGNFTLVGGVVPNELTLDADYTTGGYITLDAQCTAHFTEDSSDGDFSAGFYTDNYSNNPFPVGPSTDPLLPTDLTLSYSTQAGSPFTGSGLDTDMLKLKIAAGKYVEIGERYLRIYNSTGTLDTTLAASEAAVPYAGVLDLTHARANTINSLVARINAVYSGDGTSEAGSGAGNDASVNLLKGIYQTTGATFKEIGGIQSSSASGAEGDMAEFSNLKTVSLKLTNNNTPIPGKTGTTWLQNNKISRGKADVTLDLTMTAENDFLYEKYKQNISIPLVRLDFGTSGSIALTNGTITSFSRPLSPGGEIVDTMSIKFRGAGDYKNFSAYAISADWTV